MERSTSRGAGSDGPAGLPSAWLLITGTSTAVSLVLASLLLYEVLNVGLFASPERLSQYHFGSEAMLEAGGWRYSSQVVYSATTGFEACLAGAIGIVLVLSLRHRRRVWAAVGTLGLVLCVVGMRHV